MTSLTYCDPESEIKNVGMPYRPVWFRIASAADAEVASTAGYSSRNLEKISMIAIRYLFPFSSSGRGPIVSIAS